MSDHQIDIRHELGLYGTTDLLRQQQQLSPTALTSNGSIERNRLSTTTTAAQNKGPPAVGCASIVRPSQSSSNLPSDANRRPSAIHRSLSYHFRKVSMADEQREPLLEVKTGATSGAKGEPTPVTFRADRSATPQRNTSYGTLYPPIYQKLNTLHRLSFADVVERITLTWENINVYAPIGGGGGVDVVVVKNGLSASNAKVETPRQKHILKDVSGAVEPGTLLAVMGASGSGKTTLLNVLTYRNRGNLSVMGQVRVNGGIIGKGMSSMSGYIQQEDLFIGTLTVREHLWFQMSLNKCADVLIGIPGKIKGISGGEKKRLAFASEVITNPPLLFLDEPTSGLDSYMAQNSLMTLKMMAARGRTIVCTIHQPSSEVFELFDRLLLMAEGRVAYHGPAKDAANFFSECGYVLPPNYNPADYLVHTLAIEPDHEEHCRDKVKFICDSYQRSSQAEHARQVIYSANFHEDGSMYEEDSFAQVSPYKSSWFVQFYVVLWRCALNNIREPAILRTRLFQVTVLAFIFGLIYWQQNIDQIGITNINGALFLMETQMTFGFIFNVVMTFPPEFPVFNREHFDGTYRVDIYFLCKTLAEVPQFILLPLVFTIIMYFCVGLYLSAEAFFIAFAVNFLVCNVAVSFGYLLSCATSNVGLALAIAPLFVVPCSMIGGFFVNPASVPVYFVWLKYVSWFTYANEILVVNQWRHITSIACSGYEIKSEDVTTSSYVDSLVANMTQSFLPTSSPGKASCISTGKDVMDLFGYKESNIPFDFFMLIILLLGFRTVAFIFLYIRSRKTYKITDNKPPTRQL